MNKRDDCHYKAIVCKRGERRFVKKPKKPKYGNISDRKGRHKADGNHDEVAAVQVGNALQQVVETGDDHDGNGDNKE